MSTVSVGNSFVIRREPLDEPNHLQIALRLTLQTTARLDVVEIAVDVELQQDRGIHLRHGPIELLFPDVRGGCASGMRRKVSRGDGMPAPRSTGHNLQRLVSCSAEPPTAGRLCSSGVRAG
jgi:hypothetical protein